MNMHNVYSPSQHCESPLFVDPSGCVAAVVHSEVEHSSRIFSRSFPLLFPELFSTQSLCRGEYVRSAAK